MRGEAQKASVSQASSQCMGVDRQGTSTHLSGKSRLRRFHMNGETVLLRVVDGAWEGWKWMALDEFLQRISMDTWDSRQALVGMVLPPARSGTA